MSKRLDFRLSNEYPGLTMLTILFENNIVDIEFNPWGTNEVGLSFQRQFVNQEEIEQVMSLYFKNLLTGEIKSDDDIDDLIKISNRKLTEDILNDKACVPEGFVYTGNKEKLRANYLWLIENNFW